MRECVIKNESGRRCSDARFMIGPGWSDHLAVLRYV
jgi:hypothetical protein